MLPTTAPQPAWPLAHPLPPLGAANLWWAPPGFGKRSRLKQLLGDRPTTDLGPQGGPEDLAAALGVPVNGGLLWAWLAAQGDRPAALVLPWGPWAGHRLGPEWLGSWPLQGHPHALVLLAEGPLLLPESAKACVAPWVQVGPLDLAYPPEGLGPWLAALGLPSLEAQRFWRWTGGWPEGLALAAAGQGEAAAQRFAERVPPTWPPALRALALAAASWPALPQAEAAAWVGGAWPEQLTQGGAWWPEGEAWAWRPVAREAALALRASGPWWRALPWASQGPVLAGLFGAQDETEAWRLGLDLGWRQAWRAVRSLESQWDEGAWAAWPAAQLLAAQVALEAGQEALALRHLARLPEGGQGLPAGFLAARALLLAQLALGQGDAAQAEAALAQAEALGEDEALRWACMQLRVHLRLGQGALEAALAQAEAAIQGPEPQGPAARRTRLELMALVGSQRALWGPLGQAEGTLRALLTELELQGALSEGLGLQDLAASALAATLALLGRPVEARKALAALPDEGEGGEEAMLHRARALALLGEASAEALWQLALQRREGRPGWAWPAWEWAALRPQGAPAGLVDAALRLAEGGRPLLRAWAALEAVAEALASGRLAEAEGRWASLPEGPSGSLAEAYRQALGLRLGRLKQVAPGLEAQAIARLRPAPEAQAASPAPAALGPSLRLFGPALLSVEGEAVTKWPRRQARMLLLALALHPQGVHRSQLLAWLWPHMEEAGAASQLHNATAALRAALEPKLAPRAPSQHLLWLGQRLRLQGVASDLDAAEAQWAQWQSAQGGQGPQARALALALLALPPLGGDEPWPDAWLVLRHRWAQRQALLVDWALALPELGLELRAAAEAFQAR